MRPEVDNRGSVDHPFGYVYVNYTRVGFANEEVWPTDGYSATNEDLELAADILQESFGYGWYFEELDEEDDDYYDEDYDSYYGMDDDEEDEEYND